MNQTWHSLSSNIQISLMAILNLLIFESYYYQNFINSSPTSVTSYDYNSDSATLRHELTTWKLL